MVCLKIDWGGGAGTAGGGGKVAIATGPPHQDLCDTHKNRENQLGQQNRMAF